MRTKTKMIIALNLWVCVKIALADLQILPECANCGCCVNSECFQAGYCFRGCREGYWGNKCQKLCPQYCISCGRNTGELYGTTIHECYKCIKGRFPANNMDGCSNKCPTKCKACYSANNCTECAPGFYNTMTISNCSMKCPVNCKECLSEDWCTACVPGYFPVRNMCQRKCPPNCVECTTNKQCSSCHPEYYGRDEDGISCKHKCPSTCKQIPGMRICDENAGHCLFGCIIGYSGSHCNDTCSESCVDDLCDQRLGTCLKGCRVSDRQNLDLQCKTADDGMFLEKTVVAPICATVALVNIGLIGGCIIYRRRRRPRGEHNQRTGCSNSTYFDIMNHEYIDLEELGPPVCKLIAILLALHTGGKDNDSLHTALVSVESKDFPDYVNTKVTAF